MAKQTFVANAILTAAQMNALQSNDFNQTVSAKTASYTLVAADAGTRITMNNASATTITVNNSLFAAGDTLFIGPNLGAGVCTITNGTATVSTSGSLALAQNGGGTLYFTSAGVATFFSGADPGFNVDYLVIAGGGGGAGRQGGGGGAGGLISSVASTGGGSSLEPVFKLLVSTNYRVVIGAGGTGGDVSGTSGTVGNMSKFNIQVAFGGGSGGSSSGPFAGGVGGSGGGAGGNAAGGAAFESQGFAGGTGTSVNVGSGGGGAGVAGTAGTTSAPGPGGNGVSNDITGTGVTRGGGGGGGNSSTFGGLGAAGGSGGGGAGSPSAPVAGTANTGGGGGSGAAQLTNGAAGGSGVVILRYPDSRTITFGAGVTGTESAASGGFKRATITAGSGNVSFA